MTGENAPAVPRTRPVAPCELEFDLEEFFTVCRRGIEQEIRANRDHLSASGLSGGIDVYGGKPLDDVEVGDAAEYVYSFSYKNMLLFEDVPIELPTGSQCTLRRGGVQANGRVRHHDIEKRRVVVALQRTIGDGDGLSGTLTFDLSYLLETLKQHLDEIARICGGDARAAAKVEAFVRGEWGEDPGAVFPAELEPLQLNEPQRTAVERTQGAAHHLVWGPPGTGKTTTLGAAILAHRLAHPERRIIVLAHTNVALDNAIRAIWRGFEKLGRGGLAAFHDQVGLHRIGRAQSDDVLDISDGFQDRLLERDTDASQLVAELETALGVSKRGSIRSRAGQLLHRVRVWEEEGHCPREVTRAAKSLEQRLVQLELDCLRQCSVLCCTASQLDLRRELLRGLRWDVAFLDEASTVGVARAVTVIALGAPTFFFGDFKQLPPIVRSKEPDARHVLATDVFSWVGADDAEAADPRRTMLNVQYRMNRDICTTISHFFYGRTLETAAAVDARETPFQHAIFGVFTDELRAIVEASGKSKVNIVHAELVAELVKSLRKRGIKDVGVITPYAAQAERVKSYLGGDAKRETDVSTVHRYQGRERQVIIFDSMIAGGEPMGFVRDRNNPSIANLVNVALSRAQDALFVVMADPSAHGYGRQETYSKVLVRISAVQPEFEFEPETVSPDIVQQFVDQHVLRGK